MVSGWVPAGAPWCSWTSRCAYCVFCFPVLRSLRKNLEQRLAEVLRGRRKKSRKLERKVLHHLQMVTLKLKRYFPQTPPTDRISVLRNCSALQLWIARSQCLSLSPVMLLQIHVSRSTVNVSACRSPPPSTLSVKGQIETVRVKGTVDILHACSD